MTDVRVVDLDRVRDGELLDESFRYQRFLGGGEAADIFGVQYGRMSFNDFME